MRRGFLLPLILFVCVSCSKTELYHNLSEDEVNEILVVLHENGISASKKKEVVQNEVTWTVVLDSKDLPRARALLVERNLPRRKQISSTEVYSKDSLIKTQSEEKAHQTLAIRGDVVNALRKNPDVVDADVVVNIPDKEEFGSSDPSHKKRPSASLVIKIRPTSEAQATLTEAKLQRFVASAVPDLDPRDVTVIMSYVGGTPSHLMPGAAPPVVTAGTTGGPSTPAVKSTSVETIAGVEVSKESSGRLKIYLAVFLGLLALLSIALIITVIHTHRLRQEAKTPSTTVDGQLMGPEDDRRRLGPG